MFQSNKTSIFTSPFSHRRILYLLLFVVVFSYFLWLNNTPVFPDPDSFYHAEIIKLMSDSGPVKNFYWLPLTTLNDIYIDHHFLYHLVLAPFARFFDPLLVIKLAGIFFATLAIFLFQWLLDQLQIKYSFVYTLILLFSDKFIFRLNLAKVPSLSLGVILLVLYYLYKNKGHWSWPLFILSFFYVWLYGGWPILLGIIFIYFIISVVNQWLEKINRQKAENKITIKKAKLFLLSFLAWSNLKLPVNIFSGLLSGLIINPYFPRNLQFYWQQTFQIGLINYRGIVDVGGEWYPLNYADLIGHNIYGAIFFLIALVLFFLFVIRQSKFTWLLFFLSAIFLGLTLKSQRNIEYFAPFALIFSALVFKNIFGGLSQLPTLLAQPLRFRRPLFIGFFCCLIICLPIIFSYNFFYLKQSLRQGFSLNYLVDVGIWLEKNTSSGELIFHDNWGDFPMLFYRAPANHYLIGLDPTFMYFQNQEQYKLWQSIIKGKKDQQPCVLAHEHFNSNYFFISQGNERLISQFDLDPGCVKVYKDIDGQIYQFKPLIK